MRRGNILGIGVHATNLKKAAETIDTRIESRAPNYVCARDAHGIMLSRRSARLRDIHNRAGLVTPDGMPLVWLLKPQGFKGVGRVFGQDLMNEMVD